MTPDHADLLVNRLTSSAVALVHASMRHGITSDQTDAARMRLGIAKAALRAALLGSTDDHAETAWGAVPMQCGGADWAAHVGVEAD